MKLEAGPHVSRLFRVGMKEKKRKREKGAEKAATEGKRARGAMADPCTASDWLIRNGQARPDWEIPLSLPRINKDPISARATS